MAQQYYNISMVGSGNLAWHLCTGLESIGHTLVSVTSRQAANAEAVANILFDAEATTDYDLTSYQPHIVVLAVGDDAIPLVMDQLVVPEETVIVHCSGSQTLDTLLAYTEHVAVMYPLQTFTKGKPIAWKQVPMFLEWGSDLAKERVYHLAQSLSPRLAHLESERRLGLHLAAVMANNFANHMFHLAAQILAAEDLPFAHLHPLIAETALKAVSIGPVAAQTGPAIRENYTIMDRHLGYLQNNPELQHLYNVLSNNIISNKEV